MVHSAGEHVPDGPPLGQQPPEAVGWPHHSVKAKASTQRVAVTPWLRGVEGGVSSPARHGSHHHRSLPFPPAQATAPSSSAGHPAAGALLPAGSAADRLLLGSDLPRGRLGGAAALERLELAELLGLGLLEVLRPGLAQIVVGHPIPQPPSRLQQVGAAAATAQDALELGTGFCINHQPLQIRPAHLAALWGSAHHRAGGEVHQVQHGTLGAIRCIQLGGPTEVLGLRGFRPPSARAGRLWVASVRLPFHHLLLRFLLPYRRSRRAADPVAGAGGHPRRSWAESCG